MPALPEVSRDEARPYAPEAQSSRERPSGDLQCAPRVRIRCARCQEEEIKCPPLSRVSRSAGCPLALAVSRAKSGSSPVVSLPHLRAAGLGVSPPVPWVSVVVLLPCLVNTAPRRMAQRGETRGDAFPWVLSVFSCTSCPTQPARRRPRRLDRKPQQHLLRPIPPRLQQQQQEPRPPLQRPRARLRWGSRPLSLLPSPLPPPPPLLPRAEPPSPPPTAPTSPPLRPPPPPRPAASPHHHHHPQPPPPPPAVAQAAPRWAPAAAPHPPDPTPHPSHPPPAPLRRVSAPTAPPAGAARAPRRREATRRSPRARRAPPPTPAGTLAGDPFNPTRSTQPVQSQRKRGAGTRTPLLLRVITPPAAL